jgi:GDP-D-mannose dehydratase
MQGFYSLGGLDIYDYIITGASGQLGNYLLNDLLKRDSKVLVVYNKNYPHFLPEHKKRIGFVGWQDFTHSYFKNILKRNHIKTIFHLATIHGSSIEANRFNNVRDNYMVNYEFTKLILEGLKVSDSKAGLIFAGSSFMFSCTTADQWISEQTRPNPKNNYGNVKTLVYALINHYREFQGVNASTHILFNNSSPRQGFNYLLPQLAREANAIFESNYKPIEIRYPNARLDIGDARDYTGTFWLASRQNFYRNYIVGSGQSYSVIEIFLKFLLSSDFKVTKEFEKKLLKLINYSNKSNDEYSLIANTKKIESELNWKTRFTTSQTISDILNHTNLKNLYSPKFINYDLLDILAKMKSQNPLLKFIASFDNST